VIGDRRAFQVHPVRALGWSAADRRLFRTVTVAAHVDMDIWALPLDTDSQPFAVVHTPFEDRDAQFSLDGSWIAA
jgi:hypothetical protein